MEIDLKIYEGERIALVGPNGAGKTTLIKHLNGIYKAKSGSVYYKGEELRGEVVNKARLEIGFLFQDPDDQLFCNRLQEDVAFGPMNQGFTREESEDRALDALERVALKRAANKPAHVLSIGEKKRAALATVLSMRPQMLIMDEPTGNLDSRQERLLWELLEDYTGTLIVVSHDLPFLYSICHRTVVLDKGRIHHDFTMRELVSQSSCLKEHGLDFTFRFACCQKVNGDHPHPSDHSHEPVPLLPYRSDISSSIPPMLALENFSFRYPASPSGIIDICLKINRGESIAIIGENGAGKSTLARCLVGILSGTGRYEVEGMLLNRRSQRTLWKRIGMVFQNPSDQLFCPSCGDEVAFGPRQMKLSKAAIEARVDEALEAVGLAGFKERSPLQLSAGERKRLAIAAVLSMRPEVLILDEPSANLDPHSEKLLIELLSSLDITKIIITHDLPLAQALCERTVVLHGGKIIRDYSTVEFSMDRQLVSVNGLDYTFKNDCLMEITDLQETALVKSGY